MASKLYKYTVLWQDGSKTELQPCPKMDFKQLYDLLNCTTIEIIPAAYYEGLNWGHCTVFANEEGRFNTHNRRNPHFRVLTDANNDEWDVVGTAVREEVYHG